MSKIFVDRVGNMPESHMQTTAIIGTIQPNQTYQVQPTCLQPVINCHTVAQNIQKIQPATTQIPNISAKWYDAKQVEQGDSNILGKNGILELGCDQQLFIPVVATTPEHLAWYDSELVRHNQTLYFDTDRDIPVTKMSIGRNYVPGYLLQQGGGAYLEHHDTLHFHMPLDCHPDGYLVLGKIIADTCYLSAFAIPYGAAIYTRPYVIHCDAYLVGEYLVAYTLTDTYSTVTLSTPVHFTEKHNQIDSLAHQ